ncbi:hypothetical protein Agub_g10336, partial [Astrephomene gubernaculifera]
MARGHMHWSDWSSLPDGPCELVSELLPRTAQLACRLVCRSWRRCFTHALTPLTLDTRFHSILLLPPPSAPSAPSAPAASTSASLSPSTSHVGPILDPSFASLTAAIGPSLHSVTLRVALHHESKARAAPCADACVACLRLLASLPYYNQSRLQLQLPLRYALPESVTTALLYGGGLTRLRSVRLVRCSVTQQLAAALGGMPALRHLCLAHANLAALPQLLQAATQLEHLHVHGYHSLVIVEDNAHQHAVWRAARALLQRDRGEQGGSAQDGSSGSSGGGAPSPVCKEAGGAAAGAAAAPPGGPRLRCLAISAHHLYHDTVLDETELDFEAEALRWQIRYGSCSYGSCIHASGNSGGAGGGSGASSHVGACSSVPA